MKKIEILESRWNHEWKRFSMIYHSTHSHKFLCYLILHRKENEQNFIIKTAAKESWKQAWNKLLSKNKLHTCFLCFQLFLLFYYLQQLWELELSESSFHLQTP